MKTILISLALILSSFVAYAEPSDRCLHPDMYNPADQQCYCPDGSIDMYRQGCFTESFGGNTDFESEKIINFIQVALISLAIITIIYGGMIYAVAIGDEYKTDKAKRIVIYGIVGLFFVVLAKQVAVFIINFF